MKIALIIVLLLISTTASITLASPASPNKISTMVRDNHTNETTNRGKGLENAMQNVPDFVAAKLSYMRSLFTNGVRGIGQSLSDWIHSFFQPVIKNKTNTTNTTE